MNKKSPIKSKPLRTPGQSVDELINKIRFEDMLDCIIWGVMTITFTAYEWWRWYTDAPYAPVLWGIITLVVVPYSLYKFFKLKKKLEQLRLGRDGELVVGQYLEILREKGYRVFHDIVGNGFNVDHVIISEHGVFVIETKTYSKPDKGKPVIVYDNNQIIVDGFNTQDKIINQVSAASSWVQSVIKESTGKTIAVKPVVVFPGWFIETKNNTNNVWVLNPKGLPTYIKNIPKTLGKEDMMLVSYHISRYIRSSMP